MASVDSLPEKTPYQMSIDGDQPSSKYMINNTTTTIFGSLETSPPYAPVLIIDIGCFVSSSKQDDQQAELEKLRSALSTWGCKSWAFRVISRHRSTSDQTLLGATIGGKEKTLQTSWFFRRLWKRRDSDVSQVQDWCDRLSLRVLPKDQRKLQFWPENPSNFRETIDDYTTKIKSISVVIFEAMAKSLDLEENCFSKQFTEEHDVMLGRFILYPPCPTPDQVFGLKAHSDRSEITLLLQDPGVEGLQVFNDGKWFMVPVIPDALFINLGDQMQIMSNGIFKSPLHRVVTDKERGRISVAMFTEPDPNKEIGPVDVLIDEKRPRVYKTVKNYAVFNYECFQKGIIALDAVKV